MDVLSLHVPRVRRVRPQVERVRGGDGRARGGGGIGRAGGEGEEVASLDQHDDIGGGQEELEEEKRQVLVGSAGGVSGGRAGEVSEGRHCFVFVVSRGMGRLGGGKKTLFLLYYRAVRVELCGGGGRGKRRGPFGLTEGVVVFCFFSPREKKKKKNRFYHTRFVALLQSNKNNLKSAS